MQIAYAENTGAAWGIFSDFPFLLVLFRFLLIAGMCVYLVKYNTKKEWQIPLVCIISGAIGNVIDYFLYGFVIDMIQCIFWGYNYPVFNISDAAIFIGSFWILCLVLFEKKTSHDNSSS